MGALGHPGVTLSGSASAVNYFNNQVNQYTAFEDVFVLGTNHQLYDCYFSGGLQGTQKWTWTGMGTATPPGVNPRRHSGRDRLHRPWVSPGWTSTSSRAMATFTTAYSTGIHQIWASAGRTRAPPRGVALKGSSSVAVDAPGQNYGPQDLFVLGVNGELYDRVFNVTGFTTALNPVYTATWVDECTTGGGLTGLLAANWANSDVFVFGADGHLHGRKIDNISGVLPGVGQTCSPRTARCTHRSPTARSGDTPSPARRSWWLTRNRSPRP